MTRSFMLLLEQQSVNLVSLRENNRHEYCHRSMLPVDNGRYPSHGRELRAERRRTSAKALGKTGGRPRTDVVRLKAAKALCDNSGNTVDQVCKVVGVG
jgi:hypothetical protein